MKLTTKDLEAIRENITHQMGKDGGELRIHLMTSRSGGTCKARLWHPDGHIVGSASGYGKRGAALGEAIELLFTQEQLAKLPLPVRRPNGTVQSGLYGVRHIYEKPNSPPHVQVDGACGHESMLKVLRALGFNDTEMYDTGKLSDMVLARRRQ